MRSVTADSTAVPYWGPEGTVSPGPAYEHRRIRSGSWLCSLRGNKWVTSCLRLWRPYQNGAR